MTNTCGRSGGLPPGAEAGARAADDAPARSCGTWLEDGGPAPAAPLSTANVVRPLIGEEIRFDTARISALFSDLGAEGARATIQRAADALTERLARLEATDENDMDARGRAARRLIGIAEGVGMTTLARAARGAADAAVRGDRTAEAATSARLLRVGDMSLAAIEELDAEQP